MPTWDNLLLGYCLTVLTTDIHPTFLLVKESLLDVFRNLPCGAGGWKQRNPFHSVVGQCHTLLGSFLHIILVTLAFFLGKISNKPVFADFMECNSAVLCCCCLVVKLCLTLCDPMDQSTPDPPVFHCLPEVGQIHVGSFSDSVQPSRPVLSLLLSLAFT